MQRLVMPFKRQMMLCGYKTERYRQHWGYAHYGIDVSSIQGGAGTDAHIYASGVGTVLAAGRDNRLGGAIAVLYPDAYNHATDKSHGLVARYMHLTSVAVVAGDEVKPGDVLGIEGNVGTTDYHLHLEFDTDTDPRFATWSPQVAGSNFWKKGVDTTVNPSYVLHVGPEQVLVEPSYNPAWLNPEDFAIPAWEDTGSIIPDFERLYTDEQALRIAAEADRDAWREKYRELHAGLVKLVG